MLYALLAYHDEATVTSWSQAEDDALMVELHRVHDRIADEGRLGPAARLDLTGSAVTLRRNRRPMVIDGPFAETKEQLLGFYVVDCANLEQAIATAEDLGKANPTAVYEIRPITVYLPGVLAARTGETAL